MNSQTMTGIKQPAAMLQNDETHPTHNHARQCVLNGHAQAPLLTYAISTDGRTIKSVWAIDGQAVLLQD